MNEGDATLRHSRSPGVGSRKANPGVCTRILVPALGCILLQACALAPAVLVTSAAVTTAGVAMEAEEAVHHGHVPESIIVKRSAEVHEGPGEQFPRIATLHEGDEIRILEEEEDWIECCGDTFPDGWIHRSCVQDCGD